MQLPLRFEPNRGQFDAPIRYLARGPGYRLDMTPAGADLTLTRSLDDRAVVSMRVVGGRRDVEPVGSEVQPGTTNYFVGNDPSRWKTGVEGYSRVRYGHVLPGVDVVYYGTGQRRLEYDLVLAPGTDPAGVAVAFEGAESVTIGAQGAAVLRLPGGDQVVQPAPVAYQLDATGRKQAVEARYELHGGALGFVLGAYDGSRALVIDPTLLYSSYLGGSGQDVAYAVAVDGYGEAFLAGITNSIDFPVAAPLQSACGNCPSTSNAGDAFVTKLNATGSALVYSTYLGGSSHDDAEGIAVDAAGEAFVVGTTQSTNFPTRSAIQSSNRGGIDAFVAKLSTDGSALVYSTYLGGTSNDLADAIAVDAAGEAFVAGYTSSTNFRTASALQAFHATDSSSYDAFVSKLSAAGTTLVYSTYLGGNAYDRATGIAIDGAGEAFVTGYTTSTTFPTASPFQSSYGGGFDDAFVTRINATGSALVYSTYLGGTGTDVGEAIAVDSAGEAFVTGYTVSTDFPTASPIQAAHASDGSGDDAFVTKLSSAGSALVYSTYLGGNDTDVGSGIAVDAAGDAFVAGATSSSNFPVASPIQSFLSSSFTNDVFVTELNPTGSAFVYSTYLGGTGADGAYGLALDGYGDAFVVGSTASTNFLTSLAFQTANAGGTTDAFVAKISGSTPSSASATPAGSGVTVTGPTGTNGTSASVTFSSVTAPGVTSIALDPQCTSLPTGLVAVGGSCLSLDVSTTAAYSGSVTVCIPQTTPSATGVWQCDANPSNLACPLAGTDPRVSLAELNHGLRWCCGSVTGTATIGSNSICVTTQGLSLFGAVSQPSSPVPATGGHALGFATALIAILGATQLRRASKSQSLA
jgi:hypothetical protein